MSKHLLRELLGLKKTNDDNISKSSYTQHKTKLAEIYSTDKERNVIVKIPSHMEILSISSQNNNTNTYDDDLSDVSSPLLYKTLNNNNQLEFFSTDKKRMIKMPASNKLRIIKNLSELNTETLPSYTNSDTDYNSKFSNEFSDKSSYNSDQSTSNDSFFDNDNVSTPSVPNSEYNIFKNSHRR